MICPIATFSRLAASKSVSHTARRSSTLRRHTRVVEDGAALGEPTTKT
jgi:hypothetical protein